MYMFLHDWIVLCVNCHMFSITNHILPQREYTAHARATEEKEEEDDEKKKHTHTQNNNTANLMHPIMILW